MPRPLLLIVDGESLKSSGFEKSLEKEGWDVAWTSSQQAMTVGLMGPEPTAVLLDPARSGAAGIRSVEGLRQQNPGLTVVALSDAGPLPADLESAVRLDRDLPVEQWPSVFHDFLPKSQAERKLTTEDIFGDILADIGGAGGGGAAPSAPRPAAHPQPPSGQAAPRVVMPKPLFPKAVGAKPAAPKPPAPKSTAPKTAAPKAAAPVPAPPVQPALPLEPLEPLQPLEPLEPLEESSATPTPIPEMPLSAELPPATELPSAADLQPIPDLFDEIFGSAAAPRPEEAKPEFTLSGFSGIHDPFETLPRSGSPEPAAAEPEGGRSSLEPLLESHGTLGSEVLDVEFLSGEETAHTRPRNQVAGSLVRQPLPKLSEEPVLPPPPSDTGALEEFGNYYLLEKVAVGGMAELFKARQRGVHNFEKIVAIKRILPHLSDNDEFVRMFIDEAKLAAQLTHPNIVQIFDLGKAGGFYYIAMEYVDGKDLRSLLRKVREFRSPFPETVAAYVTMKVAMALDYAHRKRGINDKELKLVHRDVSPQNVLISVEGAVKLVDFGIAKAATKSTQTMAGALKGKLLYMSPEQALGQSLDNRSDIYSLGLVLFELLTGERCFQADSELGVLEKVRLGKVQDIKTVNPRVSHLMGNILEKALQKNVDQRYASARLMERDLKALLVKGGNEPTDHEVAEYVNTLLKGTKEQLDELLATHFAMKQPPEPVRPLPPPPPLRLEDPPTAVALRPSPMAMETPPETRRRPRKDLPAWLLPTLLCVALLLLLMLLYFARASSG